MEGRWSKRVAVDSVNNELVELVQILGVYLSIAMNIKDCIGLGASWISPTRLRN